MVPAPCDTEEVVVNRHDLIKLDEEMVGAYSEGNVELVLSHLADDVFISDWGFEPVEGKDAARPYLAAQFAPFSGGKATTVKRLVDGNELFAEIEWTSTNTGDLPMPDGSTIPATGNTITIAAAYYARVNDDGEIVEMRGYADAMAMMGQLGLLPS